MFPLLLIVAGWCYLSTFALLSPCLRNSKLASGAVYILLVGFHLNINMISVPIVIVRTSTEKRVNQPWRESNANI